MSTTIDERVVELRFNNQEFERRAQSSIKILDRLKQSLNFSGSKSGLEEVQKTVNKFDMNPLQRSIDMISNRFSNMGIIGVTALQNITNRAIYAGEQMVKSLTIDPIKTGLQEYETQMGAIQTILANTQSKGSTLDDVNAALNELNKYADMTIYNFTEMTKNIGTFTAAGVDLETSVSSIKGIANLAAISGSTSQQASTAMYQLSQALAAGRVSLMDWNSVVNAGMGGEVFQNALKRTARQMGYNVDAIIEKYGSFRESLTKGQWLTTEVLTETLTQLSGAYSEADLIAQGYSEEQARQITELARTAVSAATDIKTVTQLMSTLEETVQSGWAQTWQYIIGDFEESKAVLSSAFEVLSGYINRASEARNETLRTWKALGGREALIDSISNSFKALLSILTPIRDGFRDIFPAKTGQDLYVMTLMLRNLTQALIVGDGAAKKIRNTFAGVFAIFDLYTSVSWVLLEGALKAIGAVLGFADGNILDITDHIATLILKFKAWVDESRILDTASTAVAKTITFVINRVKDLINWIKSLDGYAKITDWFRNLYTDLKNLAATNTDGLKTISTVLANLDTANMTDLSEAVDAFSSIVGNQLKGASGVFENLKNTIYSFVEGVKKKFEWVDLGAIITFSIAAASIATLLSVMKVSRLVGDVISNVSSVVANASGVLTQTTSTLKALEKSFKADIFVKMATGVAIIAGSIAVLSLLDPKDMLIATGIIALMTGLLVGLYAAIGVIDKKMAGAEAGSLSISSTMLAVSGSILILVAALKMLETINLNGIWQRVAVLGTIAVGLTGVMVALDKLAPRAAVSATSVLAISTSLLILTTALDRLNELDFSRSLGSVAILLGVVVILSTILGKMKGLKFTAGASLIAMVLGIRLMIGVLDDIAKVDMSAIGANLEAFVAVFGMFALIMATSHLAGKYAIKAGIGIMAMSAGLNIVVLAFKEIDGLDPLSIQHSIEVVENILLMFGLLTIASRFAGTNALKAGVSILAMSMALVVVVEAMEALGKMDPTLVDNAIGVVERISILFGLLIIVTKFSKDSLKTIITLGVVITALLGITALMTMLDPDKLQNASLSISIMIGALSVLVASTSLAKQSTLTILSMTAVVLALGFVVEKICALPTDSGILAAASLGVMLVGLSAALAILGSLPIPVFLTGVLMLTALIAVVGLIYAGVAELAQYVDANKLQNGIDLLNQIGLSIGQFFGNLIGGFVSTLSASIVSVGENLSAFGDAVKPFLQTLKTVDLSMVEGALALSGIILAITAADFINGIASLLNLDFLTGESSMSRFSDNIVEFGNAMIRFSTTVSGKIKTEAVEACANAGLMLTTMANSIPNQGGLLADLIGDNTLSTFGSELEKFAGPFIRFATKIASAKIDKAAVETCANAAAMMTELNNKIPNQGGVLAEWIGDNTLGTFGAELASFAPDFVSFATTLSNAQIKETAVSNATNMTDALVAIANNLPEKGGKLDDWFGGNSDFATFGSQLEEFGNSMYEFYKSIVGIPMENFEMAVTQFGRMISFASAADSLSKNSVTSLANQFGYLAEVGVDEFVNEFQNAHDRADEAVAGFIDAVKVSVSTRSTSFVEEGTIAQAIVDSFDSKSFNLSLAIGTFLSTGLVKIEMYYASFKGKGEALVSELANGISDKEYGLGLVIDDLVDKMLSKFESRLNEFEMVGHYVGQALMNGIKSEQAGINDAVTEMAGGMETAAKERLDIHSPSKVFDKIAQFVGAGMIGGLKDNFGATYDTSALLADSAVSGATDALGMSGASGYSSVAGNIGDSFSSSLASGISNNNDPEQAASDKAASIAQAFQDAFDRIDLASQTSELEYNYWSKTAGLNVSETEKVNAEMAQAVEQISFQQQRVDNATELYNAMVTEFGKDSDEAKEKYNAMLQEMIELADLTSQLQETRTTAAEKNANAYAEYLEELNNNRDYYLEALAQGYTSEQIHQAIMQAVGYDPKFKMDTTPYENAASSVLSTVQGNISTSETLFSETNSAFVELGSTYAVAIGSGFASKTDTIVSKVQLISDRCLEALTSMSGKWKSAGVALAEQLVAGMVEAIDKTKSTLGFSSGGEVVATFVDITGAPTKPSINPAFWDKPIGSASVGDSSGLSTVKVSGSASQFATTFAKSLANGLNTSAIAETVAKTASSMVSYSSGGADSGSGTTYNFTQNNYSPKSLSRIDIYRQTQNQLSVLKGGVASK